MPQSTNHRWWLWAVCASLLIAPSPAIAQRLPALPEGPATPDRQADLAWLDSQERTCGRDATIAEVDVAGTVGGRLIRGRFGFATRAGQMRIASLEPLPLFELTSTDNRNHTVIYRQALMIQGSSLDLIHAVLGLPLDTSDLIAIVTGCRRWLGDTTSGTSFESERIGNAIRVLLGSDQLYLKPDSTRTTWLVTTLLRPALGTFGGWRGDWIWGQNGRPSSVRITSLDGVAAEQAFDVTLSMTKVASSGLLSPYVFQPSVTSSMPMVGLQWLQALRGPAGGLLLTPGPSMPRARAAANPAPAAARQAVLPTGNGLPAPIVATRGWIDAQVPACDFQSLNSNVAVSGTIGGRTVTGRFRFLTSDGQVRIISESSPPQFVLTAGLRNEVLVYRGAFQSSGPSATLVEGLLGIPLPSRELAKLLTGCPYPTVLDLSAAVTFGQRWLRFRTDETTPYQTDIYLERQPNTLRWRLRALIRNLENRARRIRADYTWGVTGRPTAVRLASLEWNDYPGLAFDLTFSLNRIVINAPVATNAFVAQVDNFTPLMPPPELQDFGPDLTPLMLTPR